MKTCKVCKVSKEFNYFCLNSQGRKVYKDGEGKIWHGKTCEVCFAAYVKGKSGKQPLVEFVCSVCGVRKLQRAVKQQVCSKECYTLNLRKDVLSRKLERCLPLQVKISV